MQTIRYSALTFSYYTNLKLNHREDWLNRVLRPYFSHITVTHRTERSYNMKYHFWILNLKNILFSFSFIWQRNKIITSSFSSVFFYHAVWNSQYNIIQWCPLFIDANIIKKNNNYGVEINICMKMEYFYHLRFIFNIWLFY